VPVVVVEKRDSIVAAQSKLQRPATDGFLVQERTVTTSVVTEESRDDHDAIWTRWRIAGLVAFVVLAIAGLSLYLVHRHLQQRATSVTVVVASFMNTTGDSTFDRTLDRALEIDLSQSPYMDVMSDGEVVSMLKYMGRPGSSTLTSDLAQQVCERSNRQALLSGGIASVGRKYLLTLEATNCNTGQKIAAAKVEASSKEEVLSAVDSVADRVRSKLGESAKSVATYQVPIMEATTPSLEALQAYSMGDYLVSQGRDENESLPLFQRAVELDPQFAMAYGQIASDYYNLAEFDQASSYYAKAFRLSEHVSAKEKLVLQAHYYAEGQRDLENGIRIYKLWALTYPRDWAPLVNLCNQYTQLGEYEPAILAGEQALKLQSDRGVIFSVLARALMRADRFAEAKDVGEQAKLRGKDSAGLHGTLFDIAVHEHDEVALARETEWAAAHQTGWYEWYFPYSQAAVAATLGKYRQAEDFFHIAYEKTKEQKVTESGDSLLVAEAQMELDYGLPAAAKSTLTHIENQGSNDPDLTVLYIKLGDATAAQRYLTKYAKQTDDTIMMCCSLPSVHAAEFTKQGKPLDALTALEPARPYELAGYDVLTERAEAYLEAKQGKLAIQEYQKILAHPGLDPISHLYPMAHLGLARSYALSGNMQASRAEYTAFLNMWKGADQDLPVVHAANTEMSSLSPR
jgi:tetratricopeptide (TPR) repeat protein